MDFIYGIRITPLSEDDGGGFLAEVPDLPGCMTDGETYEEAIIKAREAIASWIKVAKEMGKDIPEPKYHEENEYSGRLTVRMPRDLHRDLAEVAEQQGVSINQLIIYYLSKGIGGELAATKCEGGKCPKNNSQVKVTQTIESSIPLDRITQETWNGDIDLSSFFPQNLSAFNRVRGGF